MYTFMITATKLSFRGASKLRKGFSFLFVKWSFDKISGNGAFALDENGAS